MKKLACFAALLLAAACGGTDHARLRVVHGSPDAPAVDVLVDGNKVVSGATYKQSSGYLTVDSGARKIEVRATGTSTDAISATPSFAANTDTTIIAANKLASIEPLVLQDDNSTPASGNVKVRLVHGAPSAPSVDIYVTAPGAALGTPTLANVPFKAVSQYLSVPAGSYEIRVTPAGSQTVVIDSGTVPLVAGQIRTVIAVDAPGGGSPFGAVVLNDLN